jgi:hypothetical protein
LADLEGRETLTDLAIELPQEVERDGSGKEDF